MSVGPEALSSVQLSIGVETNYLNQIYLHGRVSDKNTAHNHYQQAEKEQKRLKSNLFQNAHWDGN